MKKIIALLLVLVMVLGLVACGSKEAPKTEEKKEETSAPAKTEEKKEETKTETPAPATTKITVMASQDWVKDAELQLAEKFTQETGIEVDYQIIPADQYPSVKGSVDRMSGRQVDLSA